VSGALDGLQKIADRARMRIARTMAALRAALAEMPEVALVPTMGALHDGHLALVDAARRSGRAVAASIFVNPLQFGPNEDLSRYPRDEDGDLAKLRAAGCALAWLPDAATMYPADAASIITVTGPATHWEGALRPGHFAGVATVVTKLFGQVRPRAAFFGEKDWQQIQVLRRVVEDFLLPVEIVAVPTVREADGLALSSRNRFLSPQERRTAPVLHMALRDTARRLGAGDDVETSLAAGRYALSRAGMTADYFALVNGSSLEPMETLAPNARLLAAAKLGSVRLLDNVGVD
jgi:pantoate--beta-alanine ligase